MPLKILAIDDSKTMRLAIKITFAAEDAEVVAVSKGSEAVARARQMGADVVLVDHRLAPGEPSGFEVCRALRADPATKDIPVLMLTKGPPGRDVAAQIEAAGAAGFIAKPFGTQELIDRVRAAVEGKGAPAPKTAAATPKAAAPRPVVRPAAAVGAKAASVSSVQAPRSAPGGARAPDRSAQAAAPGPVPSAPPVRTQAPAASARRASGAPPVRTAGATPTASPGGAPGASKRSAGPAPAAAEGPIPVAVPIPFVAADAPTPGILKRLAEAQTSAHGLDPKVAEAIVSLSREVLEQVVWEVVPELAEAMIKEKQAASS